MLMINCLWSFDLRWSCWRWKSNVYIDDIYLYSFRSTFRANLIDCYLKGTCLHLCTFIKIENILYKENYTKSINKIKWAVNIGTYLWTQPHSSIILYICSVCWRHIVFLSLTRESISTKNIYSRLYSLWSSFIGLLSTVGHWIFK